MNWVGGLKHRGKKNKNSVVEKQKAFFKQKLKAHSNPFHRFLKKQKPNSVSNTEEADILDTLDAKRFRSSAALSIEPKISEPKTA